MNSGEAYILHLAEYEYSTNNSTNNSLGGTHLNIKQHWYDIHLSEPFDSDRHEHLISPLPIPLELVIFAPDKPNHAEPTLLELSPLLVS
jgi:hypothetical protein